MKARLILFVPIFFAWVGMANSQQQVKESLFKEARTILQDAEKAEAALYSPNYFKKGFELYRRAEKDFENGKKLDDIRKKLTEAAVLLKKSINITRLSRLTLEGLTEARDAALKAQASQWAPELFTKAEEVFRKAAEKVEDGKTNDAQKVGLSGAKLYKEAELAAIKNRILKNAWDALEECKEKEVDKFAPLTLDRAQSLAEQAVQVLDEDRYNQEKAADLAEQSAYEARHALFIANVVQQVQENKMGLEKYILDVEDQFKRVAGALNLDVEFDAGLKAPSLKIVEAILALRERSKNQQKQIGELQKTVQELSTELTNLKTGQLKELSGKLSELEKIVIAEREARRKFEKLQSLFTPEEAKVVQEGNNIIIRLHGINFASGRAIIDPEYFPLLTKVIEAIEEYPEAHIRIEGHTDSRGSSQVNERLSTERAKAVLQYIVANSNLDSSQITAIGYGEDRPIASNDTPEGRSLNRRIDVVIVQKPKR